MLYFDKAFGGGVSGQHHIAQAKHTQSVRGHFSGHNAGLVPANGIFAGNAAAIIPQEVYREMDTQTKQLMRAPNLTLLNDLLPLAKALPVGKIEHVYRQASNAGVVVTDLDGTTDAQIDKVDYTYASAIKVIHKSGFGAPWMQIEGQRSEGFDQLIDDQATSVRIMQEAIAGHIYGGADVTFKGISAYGIKTAASTVDVDLDSDGLNIDFTSGSATAEAIRTGWLGLVDALRITNNVGEDITFYVSREIMSNFQRFYSTSDVGFGTILDALKQIAGVADIKEDAQLSGNEVVGLVLDARFIRPLVGMAVTTVPVVRQQPFDAYNFITWANVGLEIKADHAGRSGVMYAREIA